MAENEFVNEVEVLRAQLGLLNKKLDREKSAKKEAEFLLEIKAKQLYTALEERTKLAHDLSTSKLELKALLLNSENEFKFLLDSIIDVVYELNNEGFIIKMNGGYARILGYGLADLIGKNYVDFIPEPYKAEVVGFYVKQIENLQTDSFKEIPLLAKDGNIVWLGQTVRLIVENGHFKKAVVVARDISEQRQISEMHEAERARLNLLIDSMPQAILLEDEHRKIIKVNQEFCNLFSIPVEPNMLIGADCTESAKESKHLFENEDQFEKEIDKILRDKKLVTQQYLKMLNGKVLLRDYIPIISSNQYLGHMWVYHDMTMMEQKDFLLAQSELKYSRILENLELGIIEVDCNENITRVFPKFEALTGYNATELIGKNAKDLFLSDELRAKAEEINKQRLGKKSSAYETVLISKTGEVKNVLVSGAPILNGEGKVTGSIGIHFDISEMKNLEKYLRKAKDEAESAKKAEQIFTARMSHEVKTPLTALQGTLALMEAQVVDSQILGYIKSATEAANHLKSLVDDILEMSRLKAGKFKPKYEKFELKPFLLSVIENFRILAQEKGLELIFIYEDSALATVVLDKKMLYQIITNLMSNAIKFTKNGYVGLNINSRMQGANKHVLIIDVFDSGIGIGDEDKNVIFSNYGRSESVENKFDGAGLGLGIVSGFTELMEGNVSMSSELGKGSCFTLNFNIDLDRKITEPIVKLSQKDKVPLKKIFVVDDSHQIRSYTENVLNQYELKVQVFPDGYAALGAIKGKPHPQMIIVDFRMPFLTGVEVADKLRKADYFGKIVLMSASPIETLEEIAKDSKIDLVLSKPFMPKDLVALLDGYFILSKKKGLDSLASNFYLPEFDNRHIRNIYGTNAKYFKQSLTIFLREIDQTIEALKIDFNSRNYQELSFKLHKLKPSLNMVNLVDLSAEVGVLEKELMEKFDLSKTSEIMEQLIEQVGQHKIILKTQLKKLQSYV